MTALTLPRETLELLKTTVTADVSPAGTPQFAFTVPGDRPVTWVDGAWDDDAVQIGALFERVALTPLIGPGGEVTLTPGDYQVWIRNTDTPEIPVEQFGLLTIT